MAKFKILKILLGHDYTLSAGAWYKNVSESFFNGLTALRQAMLNSALFYHYSAVLSW